MAKTMLLYGPSGSFKTSNIGQAAQWAVQRYGGIVRGLFGDNYGPLQQEIAWGLVQPWNLTTIKPPLDPLSILLACGDGLWPEQLIDGVAVAAAKSLNDPRLVKTTDWSGIAAYIIEGLKENAYLIMRSLEERQRSTGEPLVADFGEMIGNTSVKYAMASRGTYGFVQNQTHRYAKGKFPGLPVPWVFLTTHEYRGQDKSGKVLIGPKIAGKAMTADVCEWFDHVIHFEQYQYKAQLTKEESAMAGGAKEVVRTGTRAWFAKHIDEEVNKPWPAKLGVPPYLMQHIYKRWPRGYVPITFDVVNGEFQYTSSIRTLLELIDPAGESVV